jgi:peptidyl-prolyl cis-trans isomerase D
VLDLMRKHAQSWFIKVALGGIAIVFIFFFGWGGSMREKRRDYLADVNGTIISTEQFQTILNMEREALQRQFQGHMPPELEKQLKKRVADGLINQTLLIQEAKRLGLSVTDEFLIKSIRGNRMFQRDGGFDENLYRMVLRDQFKMTPTVFEQFLRNQLLAAQVEDLLTDSVKTTPDEIKTFWHFLDDKLNLAILLVKAEVQKEGTPDAKALDEYYQKHKTQYEIPPTVTVQYVSFSWKDAEKQVSVSEDEARKYYANHPKEYTTPERIHIRQILIKVPPETDKEKTDAALKKAEEIRDKIKAGEDFATLAKKESQDEASAEKGGDLGFFSKRALDPRLEKAAEKLQPGQVSDPIRTEQGYHLISVVEKKPETQLEFDSVKDKITQLLIEERAKKKINADANEFYEKVYRTENLEAPAKEFGFQVHEAGPVSKAGGIPELGQDPKIMDEAFQLRINEISRLVHSGDKYVVMKLLQKHKERIPPLEEIRSAVEQDYLKDQAIVAAQKKASEIIEALKEPSADPQEVAKKFSLTWEDLAPVTRTAKFVEKLGSSSQISDMLTTLSTAAPLFPTPVAVPDGAAVVRLAKLQAASDEDYAKEAPALETQVLQWRRAEFLNGWQKVLTEKAKIDLNEKML